MYTRSLLILTGPSEGERTGLPQVSPVERGAGARAPRAASVVASLPAFSFSRSASAVTVLHVVPRAAENESASGEFCCFHIYLLLFLCDNTLRGE